MVSQENGIKFKYLQNPINFFKKKEKVIRFVNVEANLGYGIYLLRFFTNKLFLIDINSRRKFNFSYML
jgi:hypothetical protein